MFTKVCRMLTYLYCMLTYGGIYLLLTCKIYFVNIIMLKCDYFNSQLINVDVEHSHV